MHFFNSAHLGDSVIQMNFMRRVWVAYGYDIHFYAPDAYLTQLRALIDPDWGRHFDIQSIEKRPQEAVESWIGANGYYYQSPLRGQYHWFYLDFFRHLSEKVGIKTPIVTETDLLFESPLFHEIEKCDILAINCQPLSGQYHYVAENWTRAINRWKETYKVIPVSPVPGLVSTMDRGMDILNIGRLAVGAKRVIAVGTGPMHACLNTAAAKNVEHWHIFESTNRYQYLPNITQHFNDSELDAII